MEGVRLRVKDEGKCVSSYCLFYIESGGGEERLQFFLSKCASLQFLKKLSESSIFEKNMSSFGFEKIEVAFHF